MSITKFSSKRKASQIAAAEMPLSKHFLGTVLTNNPSTLTQPESCLNEILRIISAHKVKMLGHQIHIFPNGSFTLLVGLAESHISVHTWPERDSVQFDVFLCNYLHDNSKTCETIYTEIASYFEPKQLETKVVERT